MKITKITRVYNRSITLNSLRPADQHTKVGGEQWFKFESIYEAEVESTDDAQSVSSKLFEMAKADVAADVKKLKEQVNAPRV